MGSGERKKEDKIPTPRVTGSWMIFRDLSLALAQRLRRASVALQSPNPLLRDLASAEHATRWAGRLEALAVLFDAWPAYPELAAEQRSSLGAELFSLQRQAEELLTNMRGGPW